MNETAPLTAAVVEAFDGPAANDELVRAAFSVHEVEDAELRPTEPPWTLQEFSGMVRAVPEGARRLRWLARDESGRPIGLAGLELPGQARGNQHLGFLQLYVEPNSRRAGLGTRILREVVDELVAADRTTVRIQVEEGSPGEAFLSKRRGVIGRTNRKSRLDLTAVDRAQMAEWVRRAEQTATDHRLLWFEERCPDEHLKQYIGIRDVMNTAPRGDLAGDDWRLTPEIVRAQDDELVAEGLLRWSLVAEHVPTGVFAGYTELAFAESKPEHAWQFGTAVRPEHRNHGLGRWVKAAMIERVFAERPEVRSVDTDNAYSNGPMLNINLGMGFELFQTVNDWQVSVDDLRTSVEVTT